MLLAFFKRKKGGGVSVRYKRLLMTVCTTPCNGLPAWACRREVPVKRPKKQENKPNKGLRHFSVKVRAGVA